MVFESIKEILNCMQEDFTDKTDNQSNICKLEESKDGIYELKLT
jgi:uncharacterized protein YeeX (DUF496 family)